MDFLEGFNFEVLGNSLRSWCTAVALFVAVWLVLGIARRVVRRRLEAVAARTDALPPHVAVRRSSARPSRPRTAFASTGPHFQKYGDYALVFEIVYYVLSADYNLYVDIQQNINLMIHERFTEEEIEFAYPTQTLHVVRGAQA